MTKELEFLIETAKDASALITDDFEIKAKGEDGDVVTNFDEEVEKFFINAIKKSYPNYDIISEEFNNNCNLTSNCFVIDPIDGTFDFANGFPLWGIQAACIKNGKTCAAVIYLPVMDELFYADSKGAFLNGRPIKVNTKLSLKKCIYCVAGRKVMPIVERLHKISSHHRKLGSACAEFAWTAAGRVGGCIYVNDAPWDYIPGQYIAKQAGGIVLDSHGAHIAAATREIAQALLEAAIN